MVFPSGRYTFSDGASQCVELGGILATPTNLNQFKDYLALMDKISISKFYIGITDPINDSTSLTYSNGKFDMNPEKPIIYEFY